MPWSNERAFWFPMNMGGNMYPDDATNFTPIVVKVKDLCRMLLVIYRWSVGLFVHLINMVSYPICTVFQFAGCWGICADVICLDFANILWFRQQRQNCFNEDLENPSQVSGRPKGTTSGRSCVPQVSVMCLLLWSLENDLPDALEALTLLFADDVKMVTRLPHYI